MSKAKTDTQDHGLLLVSWMHWFSRVLIFVGIVFFIIFAIRQSPASLIIASITSFVFFPVMLYGLRKARQNRSNPALFSIAFVCWSLALLVAARGSIALPASLPLAMLPMIISLPYISYRGLLGLGFCSLTVCICASVMTLYDPLLASSLDEKTLLLIMVPFNTLSIGMTIFGLWHVGSRLRKVLADTESSNRALALSERSLEQKVLERTAEVESALAEISEIENIATTVNVTLDLDKVIAAMRTALQRVFKFDNLSVFLLDQDHKSLLVHLVSGIEMDAKKYGKFLHNGLSLTDEYNFIVSTLLKNKSRLIADITAEQIPEMAPSNRFVYEINPVKSVLFCPLEIEGKAIGVVSFGRLHETMNLEQQDIDRIQRYVMPLATVIRNARLFEESQIARAEAIESSNAKSQFLANMSHELRTPLNAIIGYSEILMEDAGDEGHHQYLDDLQKIHGSGLFLLELINGVLDLTRIEAGKLELSLSRFRVADLLDDVINISRPLVEKNSNQLRIVESGNQGEMHSDMTKVRQVLLNLLSNAAKFTENGVVSIEAARESREDGEWLSFTVTDEGIGMTPEQMKRIFEAFAQADESTSRKYGGAGLGLTISREFCEMLGGGIMLSSEPGEGSVFVVTLPAELAVKGEAG
jgi:signal transduction histidine kinase